MLKAREEDGIMAGVSKDLRSFNETSLFSYSNFLRIEEERQKAQKSKNLQLAKIVNDCADKNFYYKYKNMSMTHENAYKLNKSTDELKQERAVTVFFRK